MEIVYLAAWLATLLALTRSVLKAQALERSRDFYREWARDRCRVATEQLMLRSRESRRFAERLAACNCPDIDGTGVVRREINKGELVSITMDGLRRVAEQSPREFLVRTTYDMKAGDVFEWSWDGTTATVLGPGPKGLTRVVLSKPGETEDSNKNPEPTPAA